MAFLRDIGSRTMFSPEIQWLRDNQITVNGVSLRVQESTFYVRKYEIKLVVIKSPACKLNGYSTGVCKGSQEYNTRRKCILILEDKVKQVYEQQIKK